MKKVLLVTICPQEADIQLALYYLKTYFVKYSPRSKLADIEILTFPSNEKPESIIKSIREKNPDILGFSCYVWNILKTLTAARVVKSRIPGIKVVLGGSEVSPRAYRLMSTHGFIDAIVIGEGERTFRERLEAWIYGKADISGIDGLACRKGGKVILTKKRDQIPDLDEIPSPYLEKTIDEKAIKNHANYVPTETMRGCLFKCRFCYYHKDFNKINVFSLGRVEDELKYLLEREPKGIYLMDPTFNIDRERAKAILRIIIKYNKVSKLHVELKAEFLDGEMIDLLNKARADFIEIGIQSINKKTLKLINRHFEPDKFRENIFLLNEQKKIAYEIQLIDGLPGDNYETLKKAVDWLLTIRAKRIKIMRFMLLPGTYLRLNAKALGIRYNFRAPYHSIESATFSREDLKKTNRLRSAMQILYGSGLLDKTIYLLSERLRMDFSEIFDEWNEWTLKNKDILKRHSRRKEEDNNIRTTLSAARCLKQADNAANFVRHLCVKRKAGYAQKKLLDSAANDVKVFLKRRGLSIMT